MRTLAGSPAPARAKCWAPPLPQARRSRALAPDRASRLALRRAAALRRSEASRPLRPARAERTGDLESMRTIAPVVFSLSLLISAAVTGQQAAAPAGAQGGQRPAPAPAPRWPD